MFSCKPCSEKECKSTSCSNMNPYMCTNGTAIRGCNNDPDYWSSRPNDCYSCCDTTSCGRPAPRPAPRPMGWDCIKGSIKTTTPREIIEFEVVYFDIPKNGVPIINNNGFSLGEIKEQLDSFMIPGMEIEIYHNIEPNNLFFPYNFDEITNAPGYGASLLLYKEGGLTIHRKTGISLGYGGQNYTRGENVYFEFADDLNKQMITIGIRIKELDAYRKITSCQYVPGGKYKTRKDCMENENCYGGYGCNNSMGYCRYNINGLFSTAEECLSGIPVDGKACTTDSDCNGTKCVKNDVRNPNGICSLLEYCELHGYNCKNSLCVLEKGGKYSSLNECMKRCK